MPGGLAVQHQDATPTGGTGRASGERMPVQKFEVKTIRSRSVAKRRKNERGGVRATLVTRGVVFESGEAPTGFQQHPAGVRMTPFKFNDQTLRTIQIDDEPWFVAADICTKRLPRSSRSCGLPWVWCVSGTPVRHAPLAAVSGCEPSLPSGCVGLSERAFSGS